jgi:hypothetical protein
MLEVAAQPPFRRIDAPAWLTEPRIRQALRAGDLVPQRRGVLVGRARAELSDPHVLATEVAIRGLRGGSQAHACLGSAARIHDIARLGQAPQRVRLYRERGGPWRDEQVAVLVCSLPVDHVEVIDDIPVTTAPRTAVDLARWVSFRSAVVVMDSTLRRLCTRADVDAVLADCRRWPGVRTARAAAAFADPRAASPLESISRVVFRDFDLPASELQAPLVFDHNGDPSTIVDFFWEEFGVVGEADGLVKYDELDEDRVRVLRAEKLRQEELEALGYIVIRWSWADIWRRPEWVVMRLRRAMAEGARRRTA